MNGLNLSPIKLDGGSLALIIAKAQVGLHHFHYKSAGAEHPRVPHGMSTVSPAAVCSCLQKTTVKLGSKM